MKAAVEQLKAVCCLLYITVDEMIEDDRVIVRWAFYGIHHGGFAGLLATHRQVSYSGVNIFRIADGKIVEICDLLDRLSLWSNWASSQN